MGVQVPLPTPARPLVDQGSLFFIPIGAVDVVKRTEVGTSTAPGLIDAPGIVQNLRIQAVVNEQPMELAQSQFILALENERQYSEVAEIEVALTTKMSQLRDRLEDFQFFLSALRPATPTPGGP